MFDMIDAAVGFLGPDLDPLQEDLYDLGRRHVNYGVYPKFFKSMGLAVLAGLEEFVAEFGAATKTRELTPEGKDAWGVVYSFMSYHMVVGLKDATEDRRKKEEAKTKKSAPSSSTAPSSRRSSV